MSAQRVVIVGGGVVGVCCAEALLRRGASVRIIDKGAVGAGCSFGNSGFIAPGHAPLCRPGLFEQAMASMVDPDAAFHIAPTTDERTLEWLRRFRDACTQERFDFCMRALGDLGRDMLDRFADLVGRHAVECDFRAGGSDKVCYSERTRLGAADEVATLRSLGLPAETLDHATARARQPSLRDGALGGGAAHLGASINPHRFVTQLAERLAALGCAIDAQTQIAEIVMRGGRRPGVALACGAVVEADAVVVATGLATQALLEPLGVAIPMTNATGYHLDIRGLGRFVPRTAVLPDADVILTPLDDFVRVSGTVAIGPGAVALRERRMRVMLERTLALAPALAQGEIVSRWEGHRPCGPDGLPVIGPVPGAPGVFVATAHARLGLSLGPATGELIASMVCGETTAFDASAFRVDRF